MNSIRNFLIISLIASCVPVFGQLEKKWFIEKKVSPRIQKLNAELFVALFEGNIARVKQSLDDGANVNATTRLYSFGDIHAETALSLVVRLPNHMIKNRIGKAQILLEYGANLNCFDDYGRTPLIAACLHSNVELCKLLIEHGADVNGKDKYGNITPLQSAESKEIRQMLIQHGATEENEMKAASITTSKTKALTQHPKNTRWERWKAKVRNFFKRS